MRELCAGYYKRDEIAECLDLDAKSRNFARDVKNTLTKLGFEYQNYSSKGVEIVSVPPVGEARMRFLMIYAFRADKQTDIHTFTVFLLLLMFDEGFRTAPGVARADYVFKNYGIQVDNEALRRYFKRLTDKRCLFPTTNRKEEGNWWRSSSLHILPGEESNLEQYISSTCKKINGDGSRDYTVREKISWDNEEFQEYKKEESILISANTDENGNPDWRLIEMELWEDFHAKYYNVREYKLCAWGALHDLADDILDSAIAMGKYDSIISKMKEAECKVFLDDYYWEDADEALPF